MSDHEAKINEVLLFKKSLTKQNIVQQGCFSHIQHLLL